jgi:hypothetical protein
MNLEDDSYLRNLIDGLLKENPPPAVKNSPPLSKR